MKKILFQTPYSIFAAFGFISLSTGGGVMQLDANIEAWISIWDAITLPMWRFLLWPIEELFGLSIPELILHWLSLGVIVFGMTLRSFKALASKTEPGSIKLSSKTGLQLRVYLIGVSAFIIIWPAYIFFMFLISVLFLFAVDDGKGKIDVENTRTALLAFWETAGWFLLIVAINYALLFKDGGLRW